MHRRTVALERAEAYVGGINKNDRGYPVITDPRERITMVIRIAEYLLAGDES